MKVHIILNSHLDPVWLWTWPQGVDEVLATARTACDLLDDYPEIYITRGEAWFYKVILEYDPELFQRIKHYVDSGRWQVVGGWWIQPDCNMPTAESFEKQAELALRFLEKHLHTHVSVGYNVDSFGHAATLPDFYTAAGIDNYVMMRPQEHEKELPANLFTWESPSGKRLTTFRISNSYTCTGSTKKIIENLDHSIAAANKELNHTMCFIGTGDHGGGPIRREIDWLLENLHYKPGIELIFSHPHAFFEEVRSSKITLPVVKDELQYHAVGSYSVEHRNRQNMRRAEELVIQAENILKQNSLDSFPQSRKKLDLAWQRILFNQFHDILAGSSIKSAYENATDELGEAKTISRDIIVAYTRRNRKLSPCPDQQLIFYNSSCRDFNGYLEFEPWIGYLWEMDGDVPCRLIDEQGVQVPSQKIKAEAAFALLRMTTHLQIPAGGQRILRIKHDIEPIFERRIELSDNALSNTNLRLHMGNSGLESLHFKGRKILSGPIQIRIYQDDTDTWSHEVDRYSTNPIGMFSGTSAWNIRDNGALLGSLTKHMNFGQSGLDYEVRINADEDITRIKLRINWNDSCKIAKLIIPTGILPITRQDGCPGGQLSREMNGQEYPFFNYLVLSGNSSSLAVVSRDIFGADVQPDGTIRLTLLRSPYYAHYYTFAVTTKNIYPVCDQGEHDYTISLIPMEKLSPEAIADEIERQKQPIWFSESTLGCKRPLLQ